jgi:hypothetical protein
LKQPASDIQEEALRTGNIGYWKIAESLLKTRWGVDAFDIQVNRVDNDQDVGVGSGFGYVDSRTVPSKLRCKIFKRSEIPDMV